MNKNGMLLVGIVASAGCGGGGHYLRWNPTPAATAMNGKVVIAVSDKREEKKGGAHPEQVGLQTGSFGIPAAIRLKGSETVSGSVQDLLTQAAASTGLGTVAPGQEASATGKIVAEVQEMWCTGYNPVYKANIVVSVGVVDPATGAVRAAAQPLTASGGGMVCQSIYKKLLNDIYNQATTMFSSSLKQAAQASAGQ